jgi:hypothetical protein
MIKTKGVLHVTIPGQRPRSQPQLTGKIPRLRTQPQENKKEIERAVAK